MAAAVSCRSYSELVETVSARRRELGLKQLVVDALSGLPDGYQGKIECLDRRLGPISGPAIMGALGLELHVQWCSGTATGLELLVVRKPAKAPAGRRQTHVEPHLNRQQDLEPNL
jgi:hypothetical protein